MFRTVWLCSAAPVMEPADSSSIQQLMQRCHAQAAQVADLWSAAMGLQRQEGREAALSAALDVLAWSGAASQPTPPGVRAWLLLIVISSRIAWQPSAMPWTCLPVRSRLPAHSSRVVLL